MTIDRAIRAAVAYLKTIDEGCECRPEDDGHVWICMEDRTAFDLTCLVEIIVSEARRE